MKDGKDRRGRGPLRTLGILGLAHGLIALAATAAFAQEPPIFSKAFSPDTIGPGSISTLTFTIQNTLDAGAVQDLAFTDTLPAGVVIATPSSATTDCTRGPTLTAPDGGSTITFSGGGVGDGETCTVSVNVTSSTSGTHTNTSGNLTSSAGNSGSATADLTVTVTLPGFTKAFSPDSISLGGTSTLTFTIDNSASDVPKSSLGFTDNLPAGMVVATPAAEANTCGGTLTATAGSDTISLFGGFVAGLDTCTVSVDVTSSTSGDNVNTSGDLTSSAGNSGSATDTLTVAFSPDPRPPDFFKSFIPSAIGSGGTSTLQLTIDHNAGSENATDLDFTDDLPAAIAIATPGSASTTCTGGTLSAPDGGGVVGYTGGSIGAGDTCVVTVEVTSSTLGSHLNTAGPLTSSLGDSGSASDTLTVDDVPAFSKSFAPDPIAVGDTSTLTFTIDHGGASTAATDLDFTDALPAGLAVGSPPSASTTCTGGSITASAGASTVAYTGGTVVAGATCTLTVDVVGNAVGAHTNTSGDLTSSLGNSGTASDTLTVNGPPLFTKSFAPNPIASGGTSTLTFTIDNAFGTADATDLDFTDTFPAEIIVAATPNAATTCTGGTVTATAGGGVVSYSGGSVAAGASCTVTVDVTSGTPGSHDNTAGPLTSSLGDSGTASDTLTVDAPPLFTKSFAPDLIAPGGTSTLTLTIDNSGASTDATGLDFTDNLPAAVVIATPGNASTSCTGGTLTAPDGGGVADYTGGSVGAGETCTVTVEVTSSTPGSHDNTAGPLTSSLGDSGTAGDTITVETPVPALGPVALLLLAISLVFLALRAMSGRVRVGEPGSRA